MDTSTIIYIIVSIAVGLAVGYIVRQTLASKQATSVEQKIKEKLDEANAKSKELILEAQDKSARILEDIKRDEKERKLQLDKLEERILSKEENLDKQAAELRGKEKSVQGDLAKLTEAKTHIGELKEKIQQELQKVAGLSEEDAKKALLVDVEKKFSQDLVAYGKKMMQERREEIEKKTAEIMTTVMQRYSRSSAAEFTTSSVPLPDEDFKGKIIGKEGRNIRALERLTGVELIVDETPDSIVISSFDPVRREIARVALERLIKDGRIQPAKIEEKVEEAKSEVAKMMNEAAEAATYEVGILDFPKEIMQILGRLAFRTSYGQNVLRHSVEVAHFAGMIAAELGLNVDVAKRGALVHDIGKAIDHEVEGSHVELGRKILKKYNIDERVIQAMEAHHDEYPYAIPEAYVVASADALSAARPGARRDTIENYLKRLQELENIATQFEGVKQAYAISAGRELRIFVTPERIDDFGSLQMARDIANKIEAELRYPGEIKVVVIREMRAVEYAK
ncbi:ribonuclease Y [Candidatus Wolfebacteria bacterium RIFCSPHIGHO2_01_FULL_48_22]|uniref:Ribonuclease Y n=2 Tax=Candidatus Wolfeibacteriota TaxID=1752735 RepID=A0A1F8DRC5_9BACT|nr:MAG: ribonuclease Y [Candidatus Wolfebacteria bacterium RIFCSPHIGHO2_01_FULL_48_22]OGM92317.1 MAG: ribonuclease Y [Candidatus Wolfebacteria bacterium RIFCSPLOWO2_01_FULL_47_17b]